VRKKNQNISPTRTTPRRRADKKNRIVAWANNSKEKPRRPWRRLDEYRRGRWE
jgi:hypothetical protein